MIEADLECLLAYEKININWIYKIVEFCKTNGLAFNEEKTVLIYGNNYILPLIQLSKEGLELLLNHDFFNHKYEFRSLILNLDSILFDVDVGISIILEFDLNVITISANGGAFIWNYSENILDSKIERLKAFTNICKGFCRLFPPKYAFLQDESFYSNEFTVENLIKNNKKEYLFTKNFLSDKYVQDFYNFYVKNKMH